MLTFMVELANINVHTKFQGHLSIGSGEDDFFNVFTI